jgi:ketosteroid isomerase-like protein
LVSQEDVQLVREGFSAASSGDPIAAQDTLTARRVGYVGRDRMGGETGVSRHEVTEFLRSWADSWQEWHFDLEEVSDAAGDNVFVAIHEWGTGVGSGASVDQRRYFAVTVRGGKAVRFRMFSNRHDAIEAAGLPS